MILALISSSDGQGYHTNDAKYWGGHVIYDFRDPSGPFVYYRNPPQTGGPYELVYRPSVTAFGRPVAFRPLYRKRLYGSSSSSAVAAVNNRPANYYRP